MGETCDDGTFDLAGCNSTCMGAIRGYICTGGDFDNPTICTDTCGDGILTVTNPCDDGNTAPDDGCSSTC